jgi:hypothetical protein
MCQEDPEAFLEGLLNEMESNTSYTGLVEGMMKQLISKEILYEPMKEMYDKVGEIQNFISPVVSCLVG